MSWLDKMDKIMAENSVVVSTYNAHAVIRGLSLEIQKADTHAQRYKADADQWFNHYGHQCKTTEHWIKKYQAIENFTFMDKVKFLFGKKLA